MKAIDRIKITESIKVVFESKRVKSRRKKEFNMVEKF
jgi:hypothetical protein